MRCSDNIATYNTALSKYIWEFNVVMNTVNCVYCKCENDFFCHNEKMKGIISFGNNIRTFLFRVNPDLILGNTQSRIIGG